jgi:CheY-like chemotaxis protein
VLALTEGLWNVKIDPAQLEQIIVNLTVNSREAMPTGGVLTITTENHRSNGRAHETDPPIPNGEFVELRVTDTGIGIPDEIRDRIFEPFVTSKDKATSSGLGLATVYSIVHQNKGGIEVKSELDGGTTLKIFLPRSLEPASLRARSTSRTHEAVGGSQRILLVEDNDELREATQEALELLGYSVTAAAEGLEALSIFETEGDSFDLLITDIVMPGPNGREVAEKMTATRADLPVIFISGYTNDVILRHGVVEEEVNYLPKPFSVPTLASKIREVLASVAA